MYEFLDQENKTFFDLTYRTMTYSECVTKYQNVINEYVSSCYDWVMILSKHRS